MNSSLDLIRKIERAYAKGVATKADLLRSGPFLISLNPSTDLRWLNNAVVEHAEASISAEDVDAMMGVFRSHHRMPRMEVFKELWPDLITLLLEKGFEVEVELPVMICTQDTFIPQLDPAITVEMLTPDMDPVPFLKVLDSAFGQNEPVTPERIERTREGLRQGKVWSALALVNGQPAAGASLVPSERTAELAGVGTAPEFRRKGAASAVSSVLLQQGFRTCDLAWLSAGDDTSKAVYERLGFKVLGTQVNISKPGLL